MNPKNPDLHNAQAIAKQFPNDVAVPSQSELHSLTEGQCVRVGLGEHGKGSEAFWVELVSVSSAQMTGIIVNHLKYTAIHSLKAGDAIVVRWDNVFQITD